MKKNNNSPIKKEPKAKPVKAQRPVQRETKEVLAELVEKLRGKLELKPTPARPVKAGQRPGVSPNLDRLTVGVDLGDQWSRYCILGLQGETLSEGPLQTRQAALVEFFHALPPARVGVGNIVIPRLCAFVEKCCERFDRYADAFCSAWSSSALA